MPATCVVGLQWGDEAKGKITDLLSGDFALVASPTGQRRELMTALSQAGFKTLDLGFGADGVR